MIMNKAIVFMFSGQGSQFYGMGNQLFDNDLTFHKWMLKLDDIVQLNIGKSILDELYNRKPKDRNFDRTLFTHPSIFMVEYSLAQLLLSWHIQPDYVLGASLGEFTAASVAGVINEEDTIEIILKQAEIIERNCEGSNMLAIVYNPDLYYRNPVLFKGTEFAALNYDSHFVVSGKRKDLLRICSFLTEQEIVYQMLPVSFGFHSSYIDAAKAEYTSLLKMKLFNKPIIGFISCLFGNQLMEIPENYFWNVVRRPIQFQKAVRHLEKAHECIYVDLGPSGTLANFVKNNLLQNSGSQCYSIITPFNQELKNLMKIETLFQRSIWNS